MKILLTIFVLFFSSSVVAEQLKDTSFICGVIIEDEEFPIRKNYRISGFEFLDNNEVIIHDDKNGFLLGEETSMNLIYKAEHTLIIIFYDGLGTFAINRQTLDIIDDNENILIKGKDCTVYKNESFDISWKRKTLKMVEEIRKDNKI